LTRGGKRLFGFVIASSAAILMRQRRQGRAVAHDSPVSAGRGRVSPSNPGSAALSPRAPRGGEAPSRGGRAAAPRTVVLPAARTAGPAVLAAPAEAAALAAAWRTFLGPLLPVLAAVLIWVIGLQDVDIDDMTDLGLVSVLPVSVYAAVAILTVSFCLGLRRGDTHWLVPALHVAALIVVIHGTPAILYDTLRYSWAWKHVGIVDYIQRHGSVDPGLSTLQAYQSWPGFFALNALVTEVAGFGSPLSFASWGPVFFNVLFAAGVAFVVRSLTADVRLVWLAVWLFCTANWVGQDYFSPQAMSYFLYLAIVGACLRWFRPSAVSPRERLGRSMFRRRAVALFDRIVTSGAAAPRVADRERRWQRRALFAIVTMLCAAVVVSHQLTPFMLILGLTALVLFQACTVRSLPLIVAALTAAWISFMAIDFLKGNLYWIVDSIGKLNFGSSTLANLGEASPEQVFVSYTARGLTVLAFGLGFLGAVRRLRNGWFDLPAMLLMVAPGFMLWGNAYGGEILFRVYLFSLPFLAFLAAGLLYPTLQAGRSRATPVLAVGLSAVLLAGLFVVYYGKERMFHFTKDEVAAANVLYGTAPPGSVFVAGTQNYPWAFRNYEHYHYVSLAEQPAEVRRSVIASPVTGIARLVAENGGGRGYLIVTRSQKAEEEMTGVLRTGSLERVEKAAESSPLFLTLYRGPDAEVFALTGQKAPE